MIDDILARLRQAADEWMVQRPTGPSFRLYKRMWNCECGQPVYEVSRHAGALFVCRNPQCKFYSGDEAILACFPDIGSRQYKGSDAMTLRESRRP